MFSLLFLVYHLLSLWRISRYHSVRMRTYMPCPRFPVFWCKMVRTIAWDIFRVKTEGRSDFILNLPLPRAARQPCLLTPAMRFIFKTQLQTDFTWSGRVENAKHSRHLFCTAKSRRIFFFLEFRAKRWLKKRAKRWGYARWRHANSFPKFVILLSNCVLFDYVLEIASNAKWQRIKRIDTVFTVSVVDHVSTMLPTITVNFRSGRCIGDVTIVRRSVTG